MAAMIGALCGLGLKHPYINQSVDVLGRLLGRVLAADLFNAQTKV
jgi:hypothetical protein